MTLRRYTTSSLSFHLAIEQKSASERTDKHRLPRGNYTRASRFHAAVDFRSFRTRSRVLFIRLPYLLDLRPSSDAVPLMCCTKYIFALRSY